MKQYLTFLFCAAGALLAGCQHFYTVSAARSEQGGIYFSRIRKAVLPGANYLIRRGHILYATLNRVPGRKDRMGALAVLKESAGGNLEVLQIVPVNGWTPCHLTVSPDGKFLYTANYSSGDISEFALNGESVQGPPRRISHTGKGVTKRQKAPHPHFTGFSPDGKQLFVCDLGTDEIVIYNYQNGLVLPAVCKLKLPPGSGPRHLIFDPSGEVFYTANELNSTASSFRKNRNRWELVRTVSTLEKGTRVRNSPGAIKITPDGRFFFITNRGHDSLALFETVEKGRFHLVGTFASPGRFPSDILVSDSGRRLIVSHLKSGSVHQFMFDPEKKKITAEPEMIQIPQAIALCQ